MFKRNEVERPFDSLHPLFDLSMCISLIAIEGGDWFPSTIPN
jgi:hypothetical protein